MIDLALPAETTARGRSLTRLAFDRLIRNRASVASFIVLVAVIALSVVGPSAPQFQLKFSSEPSRLFS